MSDKLVEAVALIICNAELAGDGCKGRCQHSVCCAESTARAAILETLRQIREPSEGMYQAAEEEMAIKQQWQAMIDTLIAELS